MSRISDFRASLPPQEFEVELDKTPLTKTEIINKLGQIVGRKHILTHDGKTRRYITGYRFGSGKVLAVLLPANLVEMWYCLKLCASQDIILIFQAANTGLTGGSTPDGESYDRDIVIINTMRIKAIHPIRDNQQVVCLPGSTLDELEKALKPTGREPHSVIGSSCLGASVVGGICNNSGGSLIHRGSAYTELALYARIDEKGKLILVNHLGIKLGNSPETALKKLDDWQVETNDITHEDSLWASDHEYAQHVRAIDEDTPSRFNADPRRLNECSGCAGKLAVFAVRLDTFAANKNNKVFYIGTNDTNRLTEIRRHILKNFKNLPVAGEYIHKTASEIAEIYGKDTVWLIRKIGTGRLPAFFNFKSRVDSITSNMSFLPKFFSDRFIQWGSRFLPAYLPARLKEFNNKYEHILILKMADDGIDEAKNFLHNFFKDKDDDYFECSSLESEIAFLHRFAVAGAAVRYRAVHSDTVEDIVALDVALKRSEMQWFEKLPEDVEVAIHHKLYYGHFFCHVFHQDYVIKKGYNCLDVEHKMWKILDSRQARYPAEHNVGHLYNASTGMKDFYKSLDPQNAFNPGIGHTSKLQGWKDQNKGNEDSNG